MSRLPGIYYYIYQPGSAPLAEAYCGMYIHSKTDWPTRNCSAIFRQLEIAALSDYRLWIDECHPRLHAISAAGLGPAGRRGRQM